MCFDVTTEYATEPVSESRMVVLRISSSSSKVKVRFIFGTRQPLEGARKEQQRRKEFGSQ